MVKGNVKRIFPHKKTYINSDSSCVASLLFWKKENLIKVVSKNRIPKRFKSFEHFQTFILTFQNRSKHFSKMLSTIK